MKESALRVLIDAFYLLALINPISKVSVLSGLSDRGTAADFRAITLRASAVAVIILLGAMVFGDFILRSIFHVQIHSLRLAGGAVLAWVGFNALRNGVFFEQDQYRRFAEMALVPLACPMIAGPATIAAAITLRAREGLLLPALAMLLAVLANHLIMNLSRPLGALLSRMNVLGALIRITGLVVMSIGTEMMLEGVAEWQAAGR